MPQRRRSHRNKARYPQRSLPHVFSIIFFVFASILFLNQNVAQLRKSRSSFIRKRSLSDSISRGSRRTSSNHQNSFFHQSDTKDSLSSYMKYNPLHFALENKKRAPVSAEIPEGPIPLPELASPNETVQAGTSWTASFASGILSALPLHWLAELTNRAPNVSEIVTDSIFTARRKGAWIGCLRPFHLVCKGAYRAIKNTEAIKVVDVSCDKNKLWLPYVISKLQTEFRYIELTCIGDFVKGYNNETRFIQMDVENDLFPNGTDMLIAYRNLESGTLISAMRFFKNVKRSDVRILLTENFPAEGNVVKTRPNRKGSQLRLNTGGAPFWFPSPVYEYENEEENEERALQQIVATDVAEMFVEKYTPDMSELVDPRKRKVAE